MKISNYLTEDDIHYIHKCLTSTYWAKDRTFSQNQIAFKNSLSFMLYDPTGTRIGFARVFTDYAIIAYLTDVFIDEKYRGNGHSKYLISQVLSHPQLQQVKKILLKTTNAKSLYTKFGFENIQNPSAFMEKHLS